MFERIHIQKPEEYFLELNGRRPQGIFFCRLNGYSETAENFIKKYYEAARKSGVVIEGRIPNPDEKNLAYYNEMMGMDFKLDKLFIGNSLKKWLPRMNDRQRTGVTEAIFDSLSDLQRQGKNENMLKNAYIKFMCWLYYRFERIVNRLGENDVPKILYEGEISNYELMLVGILAHAGCDVLLLQLHGDDNYKKVDPALSLSEELLLENAKPFPADFSLKQIQQKIQDDFILERLYGKLPEISNCTNAWIKGRGIEDVETDLIIRGHDPKLFYNCFIRVNGAHDKVTYANDLFRLKKNLKQAGRRTVIVSGEITPPTPDEISAIKRNNYQKQDQMLMDLSSNIQYPASAELQSLMHKVFIDVVLEEAKRTGDNLNKLTGKAVYLLCWLKRYRTELFGNWKKPEIGCFIHFGRCTSDTEALFLKLLSKLPTDVLILNPNLNTTCCLTDKWLYEKTFTDSLNLTVFPTDDPQTKVGTAAYHAERELDSLMYSGSGVYRNYQYASANVLILNTMYEEINLLWNQELKFRPNFSTEEGAATIPVIFAKVSGIKDGNLTKYWASVKELMSAPDTLYYCNNSITEGNGYNPIKQNVTEFYKNGKLQKEKIRANKNYAYGILREDMQLFMLERLEKLLERKTIKGTGVNGMEYTVIATALSLPKHIVRMIQNFDFTKKNPKLVIVNTTERVLSVEDAITVAYLNMIGFDIVFFVPTGYRCVENHYNSAILEEHQLGNFMYDLRVPDMNTIKTGTSFIDKLFGRS